MIMQVLGLLLIVALVGNGTAYILLSCEDSSVSKCGNGSQMKQGWENERHEYMSPFAGWLEWVNTMLSWG